MRKSKVDPPTKVKGDPVKHAAAKRRRGRGYCRPKPEVPAWKSGPLGQAVPACPFLMPLGQYAGRPLNQIPTNYLEWAAFRADFISAATKDRIAFHLRQVAAGVTVSMT